MKKFFSLLLFTPIALFATAQQGEKIEYKGEVYTLFSVPLESYFSEEHPRPDDILQTQSTANWRGYVGHWKIEDDKLYLTGIHREHWYKDEDGNGKTEDILVDAKLIFGEGVQYPVFADWFSETIRIPQGEMLQYVHMGFSSRYEKELFITIESGVVVSDKLIEYDTERDAYRSQSDMEWVALGEGVEDSYEWIDGRLLPTPVVGSFLETGEKFISRGIFTKHEGKAYIWIPETAKTQTEYLPLNKMVETDIAEGAHVEIEAHFYPLEDEGYGLEVTAIHRLEPGKTIHNPNYPEIWGDFMKWVEEMEKKHEAENPFDGPEQ